MPALRERERLVRLDATPRFTVQGAPGFCLSKALSRTGCVDYFRESAGHRNDTIAFTNEVDVDCNCHAATRGAWKNGSSCNCRRIAMIVLVALLLVAFLCRNRSRQRKPRRFGALPRGLRANEWRLFVRHCDANCRRSFPAGSVDHRYC